MLHIGKRMLQVLPKIQAGPHPYYPCVDARPEAEESLSRNYAIIQDTYCDPPMSQLRYFDNSRWMSDFSDLVVSLFSTKKYPAVLVHNHDHVKITLATPKKRVFSKWVKPGTVVVRMISHMGGTHEIEVYRAGHYRRFKMKEVRLSTIQKPKEDCLSRMHEQCKMEMPE